MADKYVITLKYCVPWNYAPRAVRAADDILSSYQHLIESFTFLMGTKGVFDFTVDGELLYSKQATGRHAEPGEILNLMRAYVGPNVATYPQSK